MKDSRLCDGMTIESLDDVGQYLYLHLRERVTDPVDIENLEKSIKVIRRYDGAMRGILLALSEGSVLQTEWSTLR